MTYSKTEILSRISSNTYMIGTFKGVAKKTLSYILQICIVGLLVFWSLSAVFVYWLANKTYTLVPASNNDMLNSQNMC